MKNIQMVDLVGQYEQIQEEIDQAVLRVIRSGHYIKGPDVSLFEKELANYLKTNHLISCGNGTDALQIALMSLDLEAGDEVITPSFTYVATAEVIALLGLKPVFVDVDPRTFNLNTKNLEELINSKTKAIIAVHLFGQCAPMESIIDIAHKNNIYVIEDTAQALGAEYTFSNGISAKAGTIGDIGCTSFFPSKNLGCYGDGGAIYTNNASLGKKIRMIANHGQEQKYIHKCVGVNSRLDSIQAAILRIKLKHLDHYNQLRKKTADYYERELGNNPNIETPFLSDTSTHVFHQYTLKVAPQQRDELKQYLNQNGIPAMIYYPIPIHQQEAYKTNENWSLPITEELSKKVISIPMQTELDEKQLKHICDHIIRHTNKR